MPINSNYSLGNDKHNHHNILQSNFIAQTQSLMMGKSKHDVESEMKNEIDDNHDIKRLISHRTF